MILETYLNIISWIWIRSDFCRCKSSKYWSSKYWFQSHDVIYRSFNLSELCVSVRLTILIWSHTKGRNYGTILCQNRSLLLGEVIKWIKNLIFADFSDVLQVTIMYRSKYYFAWASSLRQDRTLTLRGLLGLQDLTIESLARQLVKRGFLTFQLSIDAALPFSSSS